MADEELKNQMFPDEEADTENTADKRTEDTGTDDSTDKTNDEEQALVKKATLPTTAEERDAVLAEVWGNVELLRKYFAPNLNKKEFAVFIGKGKMLGANPFLNEIEPVKIKGKVQALVSRDFYLRIAQEQETYDGHRAVAIYENDDFSLVNGDPKHEVTSFSDRGKLVGAYAIGWRKDLNNHFYVDVQMDEYDRGNYIWKGKPETMIKKVAEAHLLRKMFKGRLANSYIPEEITGGDSKQLNQNNPQNEHQSTEAIIIEDD